MKNLKQILLIVSISVSLSACGGGGGGGDESTPPGDIGSVSSKSFSVALKGVDIRRVSNNDSVDIDISGISSGTLTLRQ